MFIDRLCRLFLRAHYTTLKAILRTLGENYTYGEFLNILEMKKKTFNPAQLSGIQQRLDLLMSFTLPKKKGASKTTPKARFCEGRITIVDLSDPFIDPSSACGLFEILLRLFERADVSTGKVLVVDEAHKVLTTLLVVHPAHFSHSEQYLSESRAASGLTKALLTLIRQQRHMAMRVVLSTQGM